MTAGECGHTHHIAIPELGPDNNFGVVVLECTVWAAAGGVVATAGVEAGVEAGIGKLYIHMAVSGVKAEAETRLGAVLRIDRMACIVPRVEARLVEPREVGLVYTD
jgi:hypothetical protein